MDALVIILKVLVLVFSATLLVCGGLCTAGSLIYTLSDPGQGATMLGISLLFAVPSFFVTRAMWRSLRRQPQQAASAASALSPATEGTALSQSNSPVVDDPPNRIEPEN